ncbi:MAG: cytochrome c3 family protein [Pseudomonadota bacterium]
MFGTAYRLVVAGLLAVAFAAPAHAQLSRLVMPGKTVEAHAEFENDCGACHSGNSEAVQDALCLDCHTAVGTDIETEQGFHGRFEAAVRNTCVSCHSDHLGRDADIVGLDGGTFTHRFTDFPLAGAHASAPCGACHTPSTPHRDASTACVDCHRDDDAHRGGLGESCGDCHDSLLWSNVTFDHSAFGFNLVGGHAGVACQDCHRDYQFDQAPTSCNGCHAVDDVHAGSKGSNCGSCHSVNTWSGISFNHFAETGFALTAGHGGLACEACHSQPDYKDAESDCVSCHAADDHHQGRNGAVCNDCHNTTAWSNYDFDHASTGFDLVGQHADVTCTGCHREAKAADAPTECIGCHVADDVHTGQLGTDCASCHEASGWAASLSFDHDLSAFPLIGLHATTACGACHESHRFHDAGTACIDCHANDDPHEGSLGENCASCHNANDWGVWSFDHNTQTDFPLTGSHASTDCGGCHGDPDVALSATPTECVACHRRDDPHGGEFGPRCDQCHTTGSFSERRQ